MPTDTQNPTEREEVIRQHLPLVNHIVQRMCIFLPSHINKEDMISAGVMGLMDAVDRFDATKNASLKTYCTLRIRGAIVDELRRLDWVPRSVHRDAKRLQEAQDKVAQRMGREPMEDEVRVELGMEQAEFELFLDRIRPSTFFSLQEPVRNGDDDSLLNEEVVGDLRMQDAAQDLLKEEERLLLHKLMEGLPSHQKTVLSLYYMEDLRLREIAEVMSLTESRVSQIHTLAITRLKSAFERERTR